MTSRASTIEAAVRRPESRVTRAVDRLRSGRWERGPDALAAEEPLEIRLSWQVPGRAPERASVAITMRTPGDDFELAAGFLHGEQIVRGRDEIVDVAYCTDEDEPEEQRLNIVTVTLRPGLAFDRARLERNFLTNSSCGVCGKATLEALELMGCSPLDDPASIDAAVVRALPATLRRSQPTFESTGGLHASGLFATDGSLLDVREDVGRHNALDKLIGASLLAGALPLAGKAVCLSGRASYELVQKALVARIPIVAAVGAPSSLAVDLAAAFNITLIGFVRPDGFNVYSGRERVTG
jgi:FdhD protein